MADTVERFRAVGDCLEGAIAHRVAPCAALEVGHANGIHWEHAYGRLTYDEHAPPATLDTVFDLASLTKVIATTTLLMKLVDRGAIKIDDRVQRWLPAWRSEDRTTVTIADLLEHASGLTAHLPFYRDLRGRAEFEHAICTLPLEYLPRNQSIYSDLGFILLAFIVTDASGGTSIDTQFTEIVSDLGLGDLRFRPPDTWRRRTAPTEVDPWRGRVLIGEVHDENGWALGGIAGHTGLFGTVRSVGRFARVVLRTLSGECQLAQSATLARFRQKSTVPGSSRALGWDRMLTTSSCGHRLSDDAMGHTGFTGTSLWIDHRQNLYVVLLTNRVHPTRRNEDILQLRPALHDAIVQAVKP